MEFVEAYLWNSPAAVVKIPCSTDINVIPANDYESQFGHVCDIHELVERQAFAGWCNIKVEVVIGDGEYFEVLTNYVVIFKPCEAECLQAALSSAGANSRGHIPGLQGLINLCRSCVGGAVQLVLKKT